MHTPCTMTSTWGVNSVCVPAGHVSCTLCPVFLTTMLLPFEGSAPRDHLVRCSTDTAVPSGSADAVARLPRFIGDCKQAHASRMCQPCVIWHRDEMHMPCIMCGCKLSMQRGAHTVSGRAAAGSTQRSSLTTIWHCAGLTCSWPVAHIHSGLLQLSPACPYPQTVPFGSSKPPSSTGRLPYM